MPVAAVRVLTVLASVALVGLAGCTDTQERSDAPATTGPQEGTMLAEGDGRDGPAMPRPDTVGLPEGVDLREMEPADVEHGGTYRGVRIRGELEIGPGAAIRFEDCLIEGSIVTEAPVELVRCDVRGGIYPYDVGGLLREVFVDSPNGQAFRPALAELGGFARATPWLVEDAYLRVPPGPEGSHVEAAQVLGGRDLVFRNTVFDTGCPFNGTQTADLSMNAADTLVEDSWFVGCGGYAVYSDGPGVRIVRPRVGDRHRWGFLYTDPGSGRIDPEVLDPLDLDGRPLEG